MNDPLSHFVKYKSLVDAISTKPILEHVVSRLNNIDGTLDKSNFGPDAKVELSKQRDKILNDLTEFESLIQSFKSNVTKFLREEESSYLAKSYSMYEIGKKQETPEYILDREVFHTLIYKDHIKDYLIERIHALGKWQHAGMFIRPERGTYVNEMTSSDPLYIVDEHNDLFVPVKQMWNKDYQARLRYKVIDESKDTIFNEFPIRQFGFIVAMNFFNHKPFDVIKKYVIELHKLLKPGGTLLFTYNNCNLPLAVQNFEKSMYTYTPGTLVESMVEYVGYTITESYNEPLTNVSWLELKKDGNMETLRGGQCLAKIQDKRLLPPK